MIDIQKNKQAFISIARENISRPGIDRLLAYLDSTDFFIAPCSTKFHLNVKGGLCEHSLNVYKALLDLYAAYLIKDNALPDSTFVLAYDEVLPKTNNVDDHSIIETLTIISLFHDLCKANYYKQEMKSVKVGNSWTQQPVYVTDDQLPLGHGEKSVILLEKFIDLSAEEMLAIRWHMSGFDNAVKGGEWSLSTAMQKTKLVAALQLADQIATYFMEA